ncbi:MULTISPECIES: WD40 repeat domain-containing protein [Pseudanabaena]|uniref:WD40 repeat domain-containing protein n=1 Tax=Pseudanabaena TaxID=1152 RepID=UPI00247863DE|nr:MULTISPECIES: hypothetical protein [Pseudanabaena]MEA5490222.1 hypothetical protein [Pseudanabaena sp. CCNP1317]WGS74695.1 hypothetical protein OA858_23130 [Pseudanabaena galeata CCNP1313]
MATELRLRVLSALKVGALDVVKRGGVEVLDFLLAALNDRDTQVANVAASCVSALENRVVIDELCRRWVENPNPELESIIRKGNYAPDEVSSRALFYFLLGEWQKYEDLDFDYSLLAKAYQSANKGVQARCSEKAKIGGRIEWVKILTNSKRGFDVEKMTDKDWEAFVDILEVHPEKKELWNFLYNAPVIWSKRLLDKLSKGSFKGFNQDQKSALKSLFDLVKNITDEEFISAFLYLFIREPEYQILTNQVLTNPTEWDLGRTYYRSPTISPNGKMLALRVGEESVIELRSLPDGKHIKTISSSTSSFVFSHDSCILISVPYGESNIYLWSLPDGNCIKSLTRVNSPIIISNDGKMLLSGGSGGTVMLWSLPSGTLIETIPMSYHEYTGKIVIEGNNAGRVSVISLALSSDDQLLIVGTNTNGSSIIILYDLLNRNYLRKIDINHEYAKYLGEVYRKTKSVKNLRKTLPRGGMLEVRYQTRDESYPQYLNELVNEPEYDAGMRFEVSYAPFGVDNLLTNQNNNLLVSYGISGHMNGIALWSLPNIKYTRTLIEQSFFKKIGSEKLALKSNRWTLGTEILLTSIEGCTISPNGQLLVSNIITHLINSNRKEHTMSFWSLPDGKLLKTIIGDNEELLGESVISPNGQTLTSIKTRLSNNNLEHAICLWNLSDVKTPLSKFTTQDISKIEEIRDSTMKPSVRNALEFTLSLIRLKQQFDIDIEDVSSDVQFSEFDIEIDG